MQVQQPGALTDQNIQNISVSNVLNGNVEFAAASAWDSAGNPSVFTQANLAGNIFRVASNANPYGLPNSWSAAIGVGTVTIAHDLGWVPTGYIVVGKSIPCDVYSALPLAATEAQITLSCSNGSADVLIFIF